MKAPVSEPTAGQGLIDEIDRLSERIEGAVRYISKLREEREELRQTSQRLRGEQNRLLQEAGVETFGELLAAIGQVDRLREENAVLQAEREEVSDRLAAILEKVDLVERDF